MPMQARFSPALSPSACTADRFSQFLIRFLLLSLSMDVVDDADSRINYQGNWDPLTGVSDANGGTIHSSSDGSAVASLQFNGVAIELDALTSSNGSNFTVSLDGESYGPFSLYQNNSNGAIANVWGVTGLDPTVLHTFELHKFDNSDSQITIDAIRITAAPSAAAVPSRVDTESSPSNTDASGTPNSPTASSTGSSSSPSNSSSTQPTSSSASSTSPTASSQSTTTSSNGASGLRTAPQSPLTSSLGAASSTATPASTDGGPNPRAGIILGSVVAAVIVICLLTIAAVYIRRKRAERLNVRPSTTPGYQTTSTSMGLSPIVGYGKYSATQASPVTFASASPYDAPVNFFDTDADPSGPSHFILYPSSPIQSPHPYSRRISSSQGSDYPYPLAYQSPRSPTPPAPHAL